MTPASHPPDARHFEAKLYRILAGLAQRGLLATPSEALELVHEFITPERVQAVQRLVLVRRAHVDERELLDEWQSAVAGRDEYAPVESVLTELESLPIEHTEEAIGSAMVAALHCRGVMIGRAAAAHGFTLGRTRRPFGVRVAAEVDMETLGGWQRECAAQRQALFVVTTEDAAREWGAAAKADPSSRWLRVVGWQAKDLGTL